MRPPAWADALVATVCVDARVEPPRLAWRTRVGSSSTGVARWEAGTITVRAGSDPIDQRLTLLHELAHWITPRPVQRRDGHRRRRAEHHGRDFYAVAFALYERHGIPPTDALRLESARYRSSLRHAAALGVAGAATMLEERRAMLRSRPSRRWRVLVPEHRVQLRRDGRWSVCATCGQRVVGPTLSRIRASRRPVRHVLLGA